MIPHLSELVTDILCPYVAMEMEGGTILRVEKAGEASELQYKRNISKLDQSPHSCL